MRCKEKSTMISRYRCGTSLNRPSSRQSEMMISDLDHVQHAQAQILQAVLNSEHRSRTKVRFDLDFNVTGPSRV